jgi:hypothetical protein
MPPKRNDHLTPTEVKAMPLVEFERRFDFRPADALEKQWFAATGSRLTTFHREALQAGILGPVDLSDVVME